MIDITSPTWSAIEAWAKAQIEMDRTALEARGLDISKTEYLRGKVHGLRALLALSDPPKPDQPPGLY